MYNIKKIQEIMQKHGYSHENDERTCRSIGGGLDIRFDDDMDEPGIVLSHTGRDYFSRKFTVDEIRDLLKVCSLFNIVPERILEIYDGCTEGCEVVACIALSDFNELKEQASVAEDYDELKASYKIAKENLERLVDENDVLVKQNREFYSQYRTIKKDYDTYHRILNCIMSQFEERENDW